MKWKLEYLSLRFWRTIYSKLITISENCMWGGNTRGGSLLSKVEKRSSKRVSEWKHISENRDDVFELKRFRVESNESRSHNFWRNFQNLWFFSSCFLSFHHHLEWLCSWCKKTIPKLFFLSFPTPIFCQIVSQHFLAGFSLFFLFPRFKLLLALVNPKSCIATNFKFVMEVIIRWILKQHLFYLNQSTNLVSTQMNFLFLA